MAINRFNRGKALSRIQSSYTALSNAITSATGGVISDYDDGSGNKYRAHIFTSTGTLAVNTITPGVSPNSISYNPSNVDYRKIGSTTTSSDTVEYLVVAGGGGGGASQGGGGGAGGLRTNLSGHPLAGSAFPVSTSPGSYTVTIGAGGVGHVATTSPEPGQAYQKGVDSSFGAITSTGGGGGSSYGGGTAGASGGSGGGGSGGPPNGPGGSGNTPPTSPPQGNVGGNGAGSTSGGGGGAGGAGVNATANSSSGAGGPGVQVAIAGPTTFTGVGALNPGPGEYQWFAGGGGGGGATGGGGGVGGGGAGDYIGPTGVGEPGQYATGGGGGGGEQPYPTGFGGNGGSGIVVVRYQIGQLTASAKATGGAISYYGGKTIHTFTSSGDFNVTTGPLSVEYVVVAGGGGGGSYGGGGAGGYRTGTGLTINPGPNPVSVGAAGVGGLTYPNFGVKGTDSSFGPITSTGGGYGSIGSLAAGGPGGSGGGGGYGSGGTPSPGGAGNTPATIPSQGNPGGSGTNASPHFGGGGGGGAGAPGTNTNAPAEIAGSGGDGVQVPATFQNPIVAPSDTTNPQPYQRGGGLGTPGPSGSFYLAGGGGGGTWQTADTVGTGGAGGGGTGSNWQTNTSNTTRTGSGGVENTGGGGGSRYSGGSGIVIIAYPS